MKLKDRIENIKTLLKYCPHLTIIEEKVGLFFGNFFNTDERFQHCRCEGKIYPKISLHEEDTFEGCEGSTVRIDYCYDWDRDGEDWTGYYFNDLSMSKYYERYDFMKPKTLIDYNEVPSYIWEIIQNILYDKAMESVNKDVENTYQTYIFLRNKRDEFYTNLKLCT